MILIVDDDEAIRRGLTLVLKQAGYESAAVGDEAEALAAVRGGGVEVVLLDMNLGLSTDGTDGLNLLRKIKILSENTAVILITAWGTIPLAVEGLKYGACDFVTKPWTNRDIMARVRGALKERGRAMEDETLESMERRAVIEALRRSDYNLSRAAERLGITRQALYRRMEKYGLQ
ncbi:MAG: response regulator [Muribaculaceae bacterium]|nr:response regulator [Muribaculaceae bacterium]